MTDYQKAQARTKYHLVMTALRKHNGCKAKAARSLEMSRRTIYNIIEKYKLIGE